MKAVIWGNKFTTVFDLVHAYEANLKKQTSGVTNTWMHIWRREEPNGLLQHVLSIVYCDVQIAMKKSGNQNDWVNL